MKTCLVTVTSDDELVEFLCEKLLFYINQSNAQNGGSGFQATMNQHQGGRVTPVSPEYHVPVTPVYMLESISTPPVASTVAYIPVGLMYMPVTPTYIHTPPGAQTHMSP